MYEASGDVTAASLRLKVGSLTLRKFIERSSRARAIIREMDSRLADKAKSKLAQALDDDDSRRVDWAIRYILNSNNARHLGYSSTDNAGDPQRAAINGPLVTLNLPPVEWADGTRIGPKEFAKSVIELHPSSAPAAREKDQDPSG